MRIVISGQKSFGRAVYLMCLEEGFEVDQVFVPAHSGEHLEPLRFEAEQKGTAVLPAGSLRAESLAPNIDVLVAAHSHDFVGEKTRRRLRFGALGYHPSLLPLHRGRDAVAWTIRDRDRVTGGSVYWLNNTVDGGPIAAQDYCFVRSEDTASTLWRRELFPMGVRLLRLALRDVLEGRIIAVEQDRTLATWEPSLSDRPRLFRPELPLLGPGPLQLKAKGTEKKINVGRE